MTTLWPRALSAVTSLTGWQGYAVAAGVGLVAGAAAGWWITNLAGSAALAREQAAHARDLQAVSAEAARAAAAHLESAQRVQAQVAAIDAARSKERRDAEAANARLRAAVAAGERRLSVRADCPGGGGGVSGAAAGAGLGAGGAGRAVIDREAAERILAITADGDRWRQQLEACQEMLRAERVGRR